MKTILSMNTEKRIRDIIKYKGNICHTHAFWMTDYASIYFTKNKEIVSVWRTNDKCNRSYKRTSALLGTAIDCNSLADILENEQMEVLNNENN